MPDFTHDRMATMAAELMEREFKRVPRMRDFHLGAWTEQKYYVRDLVETILRIRLNNKVSAYALYKIGHSDDPLAAHLAKYLAEEYGHEHMFMHDLKAFGVTPGDVDATDPFPATVNLMGYLYLRADTEGPAPVAVWDWYAEWYAGQYYQRILDRAAEHFGPGFVGGTQKHIDYDEGHDHTALTFSVLQRAVDRWSSPRSAEHHLATAIQLVGDYFREVYEATTDADDTPRAVLTAGAAGRSCVR